MKYLFRASHLADAAVAPYVHDESSWVDFKGLKADRDWSASEKVVIDAAESLWSGTGPIGHVTGTLLNDRSYKAVLEAMALRRGYSLTFSRDDPPDSAAG